jgi:4'-phosphopantetheinyl transferase
MFFMGIPVGFDSLRDVHIWFSPVDPNEATHYQKMLSEPEISRAKRFATKELHDKYVVQQGILRDILSRYLNRDGAKVEFTTLEYGKPGIVGADHKQGGLAFNLSHTRGQLIAALAIDTQIGVDIEYHNPSTDWKGISESYFTKVENEWLMDLPEEEGFKAFYDIWTMKEAVMKADGRGLNLPIEEISFTLPPAADFSPAHVGKITGKAEMWWGRRLQVGGNVSAAVVCKKENAIVLHRDYRR